MSVMLLSPVLFLTAAWYLTEVSGRNLWWKSVGVGDVSGWRQNGSGGIVV